MCWPKEEKLSIKQYLSSKHLRVAPEGTPVAPIDRTLSQLNLKEKSLQELISLQWLH